MQRRNIIWSGVVFAAAAAGTLIIAYSNIEEKFFPVISTPTDHRSLEDEVEKPIMHTFYVRIDPKKHIKYTGMSDDADRKMLQHWKRYWDRAGWEPRILTMADAERHPEFDRFNELLDLEKTPFGYYDKLCFFRWLAMATVETNAGWMSDYDTFPLRAVTYDDVTALPNDGKLTIYDQTLNGAIPCLVSGTRSEFNRMAHRLLENTMDIGMNEPFWSDMLALMDLHRVDPEEFMVSQGVLRGERALDSDRQFPSEKDCVKMARHHWAVHFSHNAVQQAVEFGNLAKQRGFEARPTIAEGWLNQWAVRCGGIYERRFDPVNDL